MNLENSQHHLSEATKLLYSFQDYFPLIVDIAGDAIIVINREQKIVLFNRAAEATFAYTVNEVIGQPLDTLLPQRFTESHHHHIHDFIAATDATRHKHQRTQIHCLRRDGTEFPAEASISKINRDGEIFLMVILRDVSEQEKAEAELREALNRQREISDLKSRLISIISHELRTPLAIIQSSANLLERYENRMTLERKQECYQQITEQVQQLSDLIEDTLTVTRTDTVGIRFDPQMDDLERFCYSIVNKFELTNNRNHRLVFTAHNTANRIAFDKKLLWQALNNLISNAIKYSPEGSRVDVVVTSDAEQIQIQVKDMGIGIPEIDQKQLFETFHRGGNVGHIAGTGLGLVIARQAVMAHGGQLTFESREGLGTTFTICFPVVTEKS